MNLKLKIIFKKCNRVFLHLPPISMVQIENIFSESVLAETLPKPTLVRLLKAKQSDVTYELRIEGPPPSTAPVCPAFEVTTGPAPVVFHWLKFHTDSCPTRSVLFLWLELITNPSKMVGRSESGMRDARGDRKQGVSRRLPSSCNQPMRKRENLLIWHVFNFLSIVNCL